MFEVSLTVALRRLYLQQLVHVVADVVVRQLLVKLLSEDILGWRHLNSAVIVEG